MVGWRQHRDPVLRVETPDERRQRRPQDQETPRRIARKRKIALIRQIGLLIVLIAAASLLHLGWRLVRGGFGLGGTGQRDIESVRLSEAAGETLHPGPDQLLSTLERLAEGASDGIANLALLVSAECVIDPVIPVRAEAGADARLPQVFQWKAGGNEEAAPIRKGPEGLVDAFAEVLAPVRELGGDLSVRARLRPLARDSRARPRSARLEVDAHGATLALQVRATLAFDWEDGSPLRLKRLACREAEQILVRPSDWPRLAERRFDATESISAVPSASTSQDEECFRITRQFGANIYPMHGIAIADVSGDGRDDVYELRMGGLANRLHVSQPDGSTVELAAAFGLDLMDSSLSALFLDLDQDDDQDLVLLTPRGAVVLEKVAGRFKPRARLERYATASGVSAVDVDSDGDLDLFVTYSGAYDPRDPNRPVAGPADKETLDTLWRQERGGVFVDATSQVFANPTPNGSLAAAWEDFDNDGDQDLVVAANHAGKLYRNDAGRLVDVSAKVGLATAPPACGLSWTDLNGDGWIDLVLAHRSPIEWDGATFSPALSFYLNQRGVRFEPMARPEGLDARGWPNGLTPVDLLNQGREGFVVPRGVRTRPGPPAIDDWYWRKANDAMAKGGAMARSAWNELTTRLEAGDRLADGQRALWLMDLGKSGWRDLAPSVGIDIERDAAAIATVDWDQDGDLDLWATTRDHRSPRLYVNEGSPRGRYLAFRLTGTENNRDAIGARIEVQLEGPMPRRVARTVRAGSGGLGQSSAWIHLGLGDAESIAHAFVRWPGGEVSELTGLAVNRRYRVTKGRPPEELAAPVESAAASSELPLSTNRRKISQDDRSTLQPVVLMARPPVPSLPVVGLAGGTSVIEPRHDGITLLRFFSLSDPESPAKLAELAKEWDRYVTASIRVVLICIDGDASSEEVRRVATAAALEAPIVLASEAARAKLEILTRHLFAWFPRGESPAGLLLDSTGAACVVYLSHPPFLQAQRDLEFVATAAGRRTAVGQWLFQPPGANLAGLADRYDAAGFPDEARRCLAQELANLSKLPDPSSKEHHARRSQEFLGRCLGDARRHVEKQEWDLAEGIYQQLVDLFPASATLRAERGDALRQRGDRDGAIREFRAALNADANHQLAKGYLGVLLLDAGQGAEGVSLLREAARGAKWPAIEERLIWALATSPDPAARNGAEAVERATRLLEAGEEKRVDHLALLAAALAEAGKPEDARRRVAQAREACPPHRPGLAALLQDMAGRIDRREPLRYAAPPPES